MNKPDAFHDGSVIFYNCRKIATRTDLDFKLKKCAFLYLDSQPTS